MKRCPKGKRRVGRVCKRKPKARPRAKKRKAAKRKKVPAQQQRARRVYLPGETIPGDRYNYPTRVMTREEADRKIDRLIRSGDLMVDPSHLGRRR